jgi:hypothetical protein
MQAFSLKHILHEHNIKGAYGCEIFGRSFFYTF